MSTATIRTELFDIAAEFETTDQAAIAKIDRWIVRAQRHVAKEVAGAEYDTLVAYKAAELMTLAAPSTALTTGEGALLKEKGDNVEYVYANTEGERAKRAAEFKTEFDTRMGTLAIGGFVTSDPGC